MRFVGNGREHRSDQVGIGWKGKIFLGAGADGIHGAPGIGSDSAGDHRGANALRGEGAHQQADIEGHIAHDEVRAVALAKLRKPLIDAVRVHDFRALIHGDFCRRAKLAS